jgi:hypothetical protein
MPDARADIPFAWAWEMAHSRTYDSIERRQGPWTDWHPYIAFTKPSVTSDAIRNLTPLYKRNPHADINPQSQDRD